jgi:hypothetical protein
MRRRKQTKAKKYRNYLQERKQEVVAGKRVVECEGRAERVQPSGVPLVPLF